MKRLSGMLAGIALLVSCGTGQALQSLLAASYGLSAADTLTLSPVVPGGNQPLNIQCVICGDHQPQQQADFGYTNFKNAGNVSDILYFSSNVAGGGDPGADTVGIGYDGSFLRAYLLAVGDTSLKFSIGIDVNDTNNPQTLESFYLLNLTTHTVLRRSHQNRVGRCCQLQTTEPDFQTIRSPVSTSTSALTFTLAIN